MVPGEGGGARRARKKLASKAVGAAPYGALGCHKCGRALLPLTLCCTWMSSRTRVTLSHMPLSYRKRSVTMKARWRGGVCARWGRAAV